MRLIRGTESKYLVCVVLIVGLLHAGSTRAEYYVTLGSYQNKAVAERELQQLPAAEMPYIIYVDQQRENPFHFLLHGPFKSFGAADAVREDWVELVPDAWIQQLELPTEVSE